MAHWSVRKLSLLCLVCSGWTAGPLSAQTEPRLLIRPADSAPAVSADGRRPLLMQAQPVSGAATTDGTTAKPTDVGPSGPQSTIPAAAATAGSDRPRDAAGSTSATNVSPARTKEPKPFVTEWQVQNPSGPNNRLPTDGPNWGYTATNTYFGREFRSWSGLSEPLQMRQLPADFRPVPDVTRSSLPLAPNTFFGGDSARWSNVRVGTPQRDPRGGWNY